MRHFVFAMNGNDPAPAGGGDTKSWFMYYKWDVGGEAFIPVPEAIEPPLEGDWLWFAMDGALLGCTVVLRTQEDPSNNCTEVYYDTRQIRAGAPYKITLDTGLCIGHSELQLEALKCRFEMTCPMRG